MATKGSAACAAPAGGPVSADTARDRIGQLDAQAGKAVDKVGDFASDAELTAKIKSKMALDDSVRARARAINVSTTSGVVTLAGTVGSVAEHDRAVQLARETKGIKLQRQLSRAQSQANYNYGGDPYFYTPPVYRYSRAGQYYETNQYGADVLRHAVNVGYDQGVRAGLADRQDRWTSGYQDSFAYQDANYGYGGFYVDRDDYNTYFREGFRRGYDDGYNSRSQYGSTSSGTGSILAEVLAKILNLQSIR